MGTPTTDPQINKERADLSAALDQLADYASSLASSSPPDAPTRRKTLARIVGPLLGDNSGAAQANDGAGNTAPGSFNEDLDLSEAVRRKRQGRPTHSNAPTATTKRADDRAGWPESDMSTPAHRDRAIHKARHGRG